MMFFVRCFFSLFIIASTLCAQSGQKLTSNRSSEEDFLIIDLQEDNNSPMMMFREVKGENLRKDNHDSFRLEDSQEEPKRTDFVVIAEPVEDNKTLAANDVVLLRAHLEEKARAALIDYFNILLEEEGSSIDESIFLNHVKELTAASYQDAFQTWKANQSKDSKEKVAFVCTNDEQISLESEAKSSESIFFGCLDNDKQVELMIGALEKAKVVLLPPASPKLAREQLVQKRQNIMQSFSNLSKKRFSDTELSRTEELKQQKLKQLSNVVQNVSRRLKNEGIITHTIDTNSYNREKETAVSDIWTENKTLKQIFKTPSRGLLFQPINGHATAVTDCQRQPEGQVLPLNEQRTIQEVNKYYLSYESLKSPEACKTYWSLFSAAMTAVKGLKTITEDGVGKSMLITMVTTGINEYTRPFRTKKPTIKDLDQVKEMQQQKYKKVIESIIAPRINATEMTSLVNFHQHSNILSDVEKVRTDRMAALHGLQQIEFYKNCTPLRRQDIVLAFDKKFPKGISLLTNKAIQSFIEEETKKNSKLTSYLYYTPFHPKVLSILWALSNGLISAERFQPWFQKLSYPEQFLITWSIDIAAEWSGRYREPVSDDTINQLIEQPDNNEAVGPAANHIDRLRLHPLQRSMLWSVVAGASVLIRTNPYITNQSAPRVFMASFVIAGITNWVSEQNLKQRQHSFGTPWISDKPSCIQTDQSVDSVAQDGEDSYEEHL